MRFLDSRRLISVHTSTGISGISIKWHLQHLDRAKRRVSSTVLSQATQLDDLPKLPSNSPAQGRWSPCLPGHAQVAQCDWCWYPDLGVKEGLLDLSDLAEQCLGVAVSNATPERLFNTRWNTVSSIGTSLGNENVEALVLLHYNLTILKCNC